jgi:hypothetical protein
VTPLSNRELVVRYSTDLTATDFFTDNGIEMRPRQVDNSQTRAEKNYYPIQSTAFMQDDNHQLTVCQLADLSNFTALFGLVVGFGITIRRCYI